MFSFRKCSSTISVKASANETSSSVGFVSGSSDSYVVSSYSKADPYCFISSTMTRPLASGSSPHHLLCSHLIPSTCTSSLPPTLQAPSVVQVADQRKKKRNRHTNYTFLSISVCGRTFAFENKLTIHLGGLLYKKKVLFRARIAKETSCNLCNKLLTWNHDLFVYVKSNFRLAASFGSNQKNN